MSLFGKNAPATSDPTRTLHSDESGIATLRRLMEARRRKDQTAYIKLSRDVGEAIATTAAKAAANTMARNLAGENASLEAIDAIAKGLVLQHGASLASSKTTTPDQIESFVDRKADLPPDILTELAKILLGANRVYDAAIDRLWVISPPAQVMGSLQQMRPAKIVDGEMRIPIFQR